MQNFVGMIEFLSTWFWSEQRGIIRASHDLHFRVESLPLRISKQGDEILQVGTDYVAGQRVFTTDHDAFKYLKGCAPAADPLLEHVSDDVYREEGGCLMPLHPDACAYTWCLVFGAVCLLNYLEANKDSFLCITRLDCIAKNIFATWTHILCKTIGQDCRD